MLPPYVVVRGGYLLALDRWIALILALIFLIYGYTAFFEMDGALPPILKRNPIWPSTFPKILAVIGVSAALAILVNLKKPALHISDDPDIKKWRDYKFGQALALIAAMIVYAVTLRSVGFLGATFSFLVFGSALLGERRYVVLVVTSALASYGIWYLVNTVLGIYMRPYPSWLMQNIESLWQ